MIECADVLFHVISKQKNKANREVIKISQVNFPSMDASDGDLTGENK